MKVEIAIALFNSHGGIEEGDIVVCRKPIGGIGKKEGKQFLWISADISEEFYNFLSRPEKDDDENIVKKRKYKIALDEIKKINESFDLVKARDLDDEYQPFLSMDKDNLFTNPSENELDLSKLSAIEDKSIGEKI